MKARRLVAWVAVLAWVTACSAGGGESAPSSTTLAPTTTGVPETTVTTTATTTTLPEGVDERRGVADGHTWVLTTRTTEVDGELCMRLVWEGDTNGWTNCYVVDGMGELVWVDPRLPRGDQQVHFLLGLAPLGTHTVRATRGTTVMGSGDVFPGDTLRLGRLGFAFALPVAEPAAIAQAVDVPGLDRPAAVGVLPPMQVAAYDGGGGELARADRLVGAAVDVPYLVVGDDPATAIEMMFGIDVTPSGGVFPWNATSQQYGWVVVAGGAAYEVASGGHTERRDLVPMPGTSPQMLLAVAMVRPDDAMSTTFTILDGSGQVVETVPLGQYLGG